MLSSVGASRRLEDRAGEIDVEPRADIPTDALTPGLERLVRHEPAAPAPADRRAAADLQVATAKIEDLVRRLERAEARAATAEKRASAARAEADESVRAAKERIATMRAALGE
jgi:hypothetical protein